jgi:phage virion morphogenesis protein
MDGLAIALTKLLKNNSPASRKRVMRKVAGYLSKMNKKRIKGNLSPNGNTMEARHKSEGGKMFRKMNRQMRQKYESDRAEAGFFGVAAIIATNHQLGRHIKETKGAYHGGSNEFDMPVRELLGLPQADQDAIQKIIEDNLLNV